MQKDSEGEESRWPPTIEKVQAQTSVPEAAVRGTPVRSGRRKSGCVPQGESIVTVVREAEDAGLLQYSRRNSREKYPLVRMTTEEEIPLLLQRGRNTGHRRRSNSLLPAGSVHLVPQSVRLLPRPRSSSFLLTSGGLAAFPRQKTTDRRSSLECNTLSSLSLVRKLERHLKQNADKNTQSSCPKTPSVSRRGSMAENRRMPDDSDITEETSPDSADKGHFVSNPTVNLCEDAMPSTGNSSVVLKDATVGSGTNCPKEKPAWVGKKINIESMEEEWRKSQNELEDDGSKNTIREMSNSATNHTIADDGFSAIGLLPSVAGQSTLTVKAGSSIHISSGFGDDCSASDLQSLTQDEENPDKCKDTDKPCSWQMLSETHQYTDNVLDTWGQTDVSTGCDIQQTDSHRPSTPKVFQAANHKDRGNENDEKNEGVSDSHEVRETLAGLTESRESCCQSPRECQSPSATDSLSTASPPATPLWGDSVASLTSMDTVDSLETGTGVSTRVSEDRIRLGTLDIEEFARRVENTIQHRVQAGEKGLGKTATHSLTESPRTSEDLFYNGEDSLHQDKMSLISQQGNKHRFIQEGHTRTTKDSSPDSGFAEHTLGSLIRKIDEKLSPRNKCNAKRATGRMEKSNSPVPLSVCVTHRPRDSLCQRKLGVLPHRGRSSDRKVGTQPSRLYRQGSQGKCMGLGLILPGENQATRRSRNEEHKVAIWKSSYKVSVQKEQNPARGNKQDGGRCVPTATACRQINLTLGETGSGNSLLRHQSLSRSIGQGRQHYAAVDKQNKQVKKQPRAIQQSVIELQIPDQVGKRPIPKKLSLLSSLPSPLGHFHRR